MQFCTPSSWLYFAIGRLNMTREREGESTMTSTEVYSNTVHHKFTAARWLRGQHRAHRRVQETGLSFIYEDGLLTGHWTHLVNHLSVALQLIDFYMFSGLMFYGGRWLCGNSCIPCPGWFRFKLRFRPFLWPLLVCPSAKHLMLIWSRGAMLWLHLGSDKSLLYCPKNYIFMKYKYKYTNKYRITGMHYCTKVCNDVKKSSFCLKLFA